MTVMLLVDLLNFCLAVVVVARAAVKVYCCSYCVSTDLWESDEFKFDSFPQKKVQGGICGASERDVMVIVADI